MANTQGQRSRILTALAGIALLSGGDAVWNAARAEDREVVIQFAGMVGDRPFDCKESYNLGTPASAVVPLDFRLYLSDVALIDEGGNLVPLTLAQDGKWQYQNVALLDFEDKSGTCANGTVETNDRIVGTVPPGNYQGVQFVLGIPAELNHVDATLAPSPLNLTSLWWNWQFGYKFARIDFNPQRQATLPQVNSLEDESSIGFAIHLGSTGCEAMPGSENGFACSNANRAIVTLPEFAPNQSAIAIDIAALVQDTDLMANQPNTAPGCMSEPNDKDCAGIMAAMGIPFNGAMPASQTLFSVERNNK